jgi:hypothetical protein
MRFQVPLLVFAGLGLAAPAPEPQLSSGLLNGVGGLLDLTLGGLLGSLRKALDSGDRDKTLDILHQLSPNKKREDVEEVNAALQRISEAKPKSIVEYSAQLIANGIIAGDTADLFAYAKGLVSAENGSNNK